MCFLRRIWSISLRNSTSNCGSRLMDCSPLAPCPHHKERKPAGLESLTLTFYQDHSEHRVIAGIMQQILASHRSRWKSKRSATISGMKERSRAISGLTAPTLRCRWIFAVRALVRGAAAPTLYSDRLASRRRPLAQWRNERRTGASNWSPAKQWCHLSTTG